jgi:peptidoglycan/LPS O-acetylase OafA/YrhL
MGEVEARDRRKDIDGLRGVAIILVIVYHAFPAALPSGFVGVDVFFVISGFLITGLIQRELAIGRFRLAEFLARRARRLLPALLLVLTVTALVGWWVLYPDEYVPLGRDLVGAATFSSNLVLYHARNLYFNELADRNPLLHLWSLGIEEQFYFVWPLLLAVGWRLGKRTMPLIVLGIGVSLLATSLVEAIRPDAAFYLPLTRAWELLVGASLAPGHLLERLPDRAEGLAKDLVAISGMAAILLAAAREPGIGALPLSTIVPAVIGAALVIAAGERAFLGRIALAQRPVVFLGLISYPLYLWHWPLLAFGALIEGDPSLPWTLGLIVASGALAVGTYRFLEQPMRRRPAAAVAVPLAGGLAIIAGIGFVTMSGWIPARLTPQVRDILPWGYASDSLIPRPIAQDMLVSIGSMTPSRKVLVIGDSHAEQFFPRASLLRERLVRDGIRLSFFAFPGCPSLPGLIRRDPDSRCDVRYAKALSLARDSAYGAVIFSNYWEGYSLPPFRRGDARRRPLYSIDETRHPLGARSGAFIRSIDSLGRDIIALRREGIDVAVFGSTPATGDLALGRVLQRLKTGAPVAAAIDRRSYEVHVEPVMRPVRDMAIRSGARFFDPLETLCLADRCPAAMPDGTLIYRDQDHLSAIAARRLTLLDSVIWASRR